MKVWVKVRYFIQNNKSDQNCDNGKGCREQHPFHFFVDIQMCECKFTDMRRESHNRNNITGQENDFVEKYRNSTALKRITEV